MINKFIHFSDGITYVLSLEAIKNFAIFILTEQIWVNSLGLKERNKVRNQGRLPNMGSIAMYLIGM
jgi:hypothetical protein